MYFLHAFLTVQIIKLSDLCTNKDKTIVRTLMCVFASSSLTVRSPQHHNERGEIILEAEEIAEFNYEVVMRFNGRQLERTTMFSNSGTHI